MSTFSRCRGVIDDVIDLVTSNQEQTAARGLSAAVFTDIKVAFDTASP